MRQAILQNNLQVPAGALEAESRRFVINLDAQIDDPREYERIVVRRDGDRVVRISDVGWVELGAEDYQTLVRAMGGKRNVGIGVVRQSRSNELEVSNAVHARMPEIEGSLPEGMKIALSTDNTIFVRATLEEVWKTLAITFALVVLVNLFFLRSKATTIITSISIPISLIGTFAVMQVMGFSINVLSLLALVLVIGMVVDDSIVVLENVYRRQELGEPPMLAAWNGAKEVGFPVIATTLSVVAVLVPLSLMTGNTGRLFREFAITMAAAMIDLDVRLPHRGADGLLALPRGQAPARRAVARDRSGHLGHPARLRPAARLVPAPARGGRRLLRAIPGRHRLSDHPPAAHAGAGRGPRQLHDHHPRAAGVHHGVHRAGDAEDRRRGADDPGGRELLRRRLVRLRRPGRQLAGNRLHPAQALERAQGQAAGDRRRSCSRSSWRSPKRWCSRSTRLRSARASAAPTSRSRSRARPRASTSSTTSGGAWWVDSPRFRGLVNVDTDMRLDNPQLDIIVDRERASDLGISVADVAESMRLLVSQGRIDDFILRAKQYDVVTALASKFRTVPEQLGEIHVRAADGSMVPMSTVARTVPKIGAASLTHYDLQRSVTVTANLAPGATLGEVLPPALAAVDEELPDGFTTALGGVTREYVESAGAIYVTFAIGLLVVYLVMAAQFESFLHPLTVMLSVPLATLGALGALYILGLTLNIYTGIGLILLVGLVTKNAILLVDFANQERARGTELVEALRRAGHTRFRPILMTSVTSILGAVPLAFAVGAGAESRRPIGAAVVGGLVFSTVFTLLMIPTVHYVIVRIADRLGFNSIPPLVELEATVPSWLGGEAPLPAPAPTPSLEHT